MNSHHQIKYLTQQQIDKVKWDACIHASANGLIYGQSFYLDAMAKNWDGLVLNDYEAVMPLVWNKKYGFSYLYQPAFSGSLGIFCPQLTEETKEKFLLSIPASFRYWDISLNHDNFFNSPHFIFRKRLNYTLELNKPYTTLYDRFSDNIKRNIKKAAQQGCTANKPAFNEVVKLAKLQSQQAASVTEDNLTRFSKLYHSLEQKNAAVTYGIVAANGELLSSCIFFLWQNRAYYILAGNHANSKATGASHALINAFIKDYAATNFILDFEGSDIPGLALFYSSFGSKEETYPAIKYNKLPLLIRWLKK